MDKCVDLFKEKDLVFGAWSHMIGWDLLAGYWMSKDAQRRGIPKAVTAPYIYATMMAGPVGFCTYMAMANK